MYNQNNLLMNVRASLRHLRYDIFQAFLSRRSMLPYFKNSSMYGVFTRAKNTLLKHV